MIDRRDGHRVGLLARHLRTGEHQQVGAVSAHPRGEVVEPEQALQPLGVLLVALQPVDQRELLIDQRAAAPRQRLEHVADLQLQPALLAGQEDGLFVQFVDGVRDLADLLGGVHRDRIDGSGFLARPHPLDLARQVVVRDPQGAVAQRAQRADQRPRHQDDEQQRQQRSRRARSPRRGWPRCARPRPRSSTAPVTAGRCCRSSGSRSGRWPAARRSCPGC